MSKQIFDRLFAPFRDEDLDWRYWNYEQVARNDNHRVVPFLRVMAIRKRLDEVLGPQNWQQVITPGGTSVACSLRIRIDGEWIVRDNVADQSANVALTRAAADLGIGRYLYELPEMFANYVVPGIQGARELEFSGTVFYHIPPVVHSASPAVAQAPQERPIKPQKVATGQPRVNIPAERPTFNQAPLGSKKDIDQVKKQQASNQNNVSYIPRNATAKVMDKPIANPTPSSPTSAQPEKDERPFAYHKLSFGESWKGKMLRELNTDDLQGLIKFFTVTLPYPDSATVMKDKKNLTAFLGGKLELPDRQAQ